jgi:hypothetical protein
MKQMIPKESNQMYEKRQKVKLTGLWPSEDGRRLSGKLREPVTLPAGTRITVWKNEPDSSIPFNAVAEVPEDAAPAKSAAPQSDDDVPFF